MPRSPSVDMLIDLVQNEQWDTLASHLAACHPVDVAEVINQSPSQHHETIFALVDEGVKPDVLAELEGFVESDILESLSNSELSDIVEDMSPDDAADVLADLPEERSRIVLDLMEEEESEDVRKLLQYPEDTAGGIMTSDVVSMRRDQTVGEALDAIAYMDTREKFHYAYIVDARGRLTGFVELWDLLRERDRKRPLGQLVNMSITAADVDMDQEEVAQIMRKYDLSVLPVVDAEGGLVGRVTSDDVIDVIEEEANEDIFRLAGSDDAELESPSAVSSSLVRLPWLLITLLGGFLVSVILDRFHARLANVLVLAAFVPVVLAMGGNAGIQSSTLVIRSLALGTIASHRIRRLLVKEILAGALMGSICGTLIGVGAYLMIAFGTVHELVAPPLQLAVVVGLALFAAMTFAAVFGAVVPLLLDRVKIDPAVASGPFVTITNDIAALLIYFAITMVLLGGLG